MKIRIAFVCAIVVAIVVRALPAFADQGVDGDEPAAPPVAIATTAEPVGFVGAGVSLGATHFIDAALVGEGAIKLPHHAAWIRGTASYGSSFDFEGGGTFLRGTVGIEGMSCRSAGFCWLSSLDLGYQRETWKDQDDDLAVEHHFGPLVESRLGFDAGGDSLRFRFAFDVVAWDHHSSGMQPSWDIGGGLTMTLAYRM